MQRHASNRWVAQLKQSTGVTIIHLFLNADAFDIHVKGAVEKTFEIAKQFVKSKIEGQNIVLKKYCLKTDTSVITEDRGY